MSSVPAGAAGEEGALNRSQQGGAAAKKTSAATSPSSSSSSSSSYGSFYTSRYERDKRAKKQQQRYSQHHRQDDGGRRPEHDEEAVERERQRQQAEHFESHADSSGWVSDMILGAADGLTVPFALAAGLTGALSDSRIIVLAVLSELAAGGISMGLGGWLAGRSEVVTYDAERAREQREVEQVPLAEEEEIYEIFRPYGVPDDSVDRIMTHLRNNPQTWVDFMMKFELNMEQPDRNRPWKSALTVGGSYMVGGFIPLVPYLLFNDARRALRFSAAFTLLALTAFGWLKAKLTGQARVRSAVETTATGSAAAAAAFMIARYFDNA